MNYLKTLCLFLILGLTSGCSDFMDIMPDDVATLETAFSNRQNAEKFLFTCYNYMPDPTNMQANPALIGGDEFWWDTDASGLYDIASGWIARGLQNANDPYQNYWDGRNQGKNLFTGIRDCNILIESIHLPPDMDEYEREQWAAEARFLKAYYHFFLLQLYGPVPIIRENLPVNATPDQVRVYREPVDEVINYIVELLDEAVPGLPLNITSQITDAGRITQAIALALKAKVLVWAASPLLNNNPYYADFKDNRDVQLFPSGSSPDVAKWQRAADALKTAIETCHLAGHQLYRYTSGTYSLSDETILKYTIRGAVTEKFNPEIVWPATQNTNTLQRYCMPKLGTFAYVSGISEISSTLKIAEQFYSKNGLPINEDPEWNADDGGYAARYETMVATADHQYYIRTGETTAKLHFNREPRFYASLAFDRSVLEGAGESEANSFTILGRNSENSGYISGDAHILTGYFQKKLINTNTTKRGSTYTGQEYLFPMIRLADLYLLYSEALNEVKATPDDEVYRWIDAVRERAGLEGVRESWAKAASGYRNKPHMQEGMREIIKRERLIELTGEGQRFWDLRRWNDAENFFSEPVQGWDYMGSTVEEYYTVRTYLSLRSYTKRDYLWPLRTHSVIINSNLKQNPGWK
ncbi:MAG: RagB/SusD family nutrient uptake outer membrane protein [Prevotellaceae bacterium]|jgi:hypothetical protein|nr:RagB/SusD family nutrient uptake outer membrane protein [Prevotellaceae bacterium]